MQLIKPKKSCINLLNRKEDPDICISFYYSCNKKTNTSKRTYRISMRNFFYRLKKDWESICFAVEDDYVLFFKSEINEGYNINGNGYICNVSLIETICEVYKVKINDKPFNINFKTEKINSRFYKMILTN